MAETEKNTKEKEKQPGSVLGHRQTAVGVLTAEDYRRRAKEHQDAIKDQWKTFGKVGIFLLVAVIVLVIPGIAWFANNKEVTGTGMNVAAAPSSFELAAKGTEENSKGAWDSLLSGLEQGISKTAKIVGDEEDSSFLATDSGKTEITWAITEDSQISNHGVADTTVGGLYPGSSGTLTFYVIAGKTGTLSLDFEISMRGYGDKNANGTLPVVSSVAEELLEGHILLFADCNKTGDHVQSYRGWISEDADPWTISLNYPSKQVENGTNSEESNGTLSRKQDGTLNWTKEVTAGTAYPVTIYWIWPEVFGQYLFTDKTVIGERPMLFPGSSDPAETLPSGLLSKMKITAKEDENGNGVNLVSNRYFKWSLSYDEENDKTLARSDFLNNAEQLEKLRAGNGNLGVYSNLCAYYNKADQYLGENVRYVTLKLTANE